MTDLSLKISRTLKVPIQDLFNAWLEPEKLALFMTPGKGITVPRVSNDPQEGGRFTIVMATEDDEMPHSGEYLKITPFTQIIFSWESPFSVEGSTVTLNFSEVEEGTIIELIHNKFPDEQSRDNHLGGWSKILEQLEKQFT